MVKRKITVTVDADLVESVQAEPGESLSGLVNAALRAEHDRKARRIALRALLDAWDAELGPVDDDTLAWADDAFDRAEADVSEGAA